MVVKSRGLQRHGLTAVMYRDFETVKKSGISKEEETKREKTQTVVR